MATSLKSSALSLVENVSTNLSILMILGLVALVLAFPGTDALRPQRNVPVEILKTRPAPLNLPHDTPVLGQ